MKKTTTEEIEEKGLAYIRTFDSFVITGNHYIPYPKVLEKLLDEYDVNTEYFGPSDQGSTTSTFQRKPSEEVLRQEMNKKNR